MTANAKRGTGTIYYVAHDPEKQRTAGPLNMMNLGPSALALIDKVGDSVMVRESGNSRALIYKIAERLAIEVSIRQTLVQLDDRMHKALIVMCVGIDEAKRDERRRAIGEYEETEDA